MAKPTAEIAAIDLKPRKFSCLKFIKGRSFSRSPNDGKGFVMRLPVKNSIAFWRELLTVWRPGFRRFSFGNENYLQLAEAVR
jgi:hypothetical protein